ncbi:cell division protein ZapE [Brachybacterium saurashtrense]|uniref:Cell division protein ZapE n=1 Tax=Brachybacterium saurashtrense TaxID=556288 RepID=A0A345YLV3_9MICO|nr:cell division protein ZapE [Brachybacterium saurashtrense]AXK44905.1 cell division protein ZapE [Brachybacterium saurashtrense]RRR21589.1 cell division protein ZapE [Brachybacterium saurashtrense]
MTEALSDRRPDPSLERLLADLVPPPRFAQARLDNYVPDPAHPSQQEAKEHVTAFAASLGTPRGGFLSRLRRRTPQAARGIYLDGGFGVGKTHLLTSLFHAVEGHRVYGTFVEYTDLVGALGFQKAVDLLGESVLVCIDEFELDDPGDTLLMTRLIRELSDRGVAIVATSNTLPDALGEGRFAAQDFLREIQAMAERFEVLRIDGEDYRRRDGVSEIMALPEEAVRAHAEGQQDATLDDFDTLLAHLTKVHPSRYGALIDDVPAAHLTGLHGLTHHHDALRFVVLVDRLYDREVPVLLSAAPAGGPGSGDAQEAEHAAVPPEEGAAAAHAVRDLFSEELLRSGYRKKYLRALSRLASLADDGRRLLPGRAPAEAADPSR